MAHLEKAADKQQTSVRWVIVALMLGMLLGALDTTIISTAMPPSWRSWVDLLTTVGCFPPTC